jgi:putative FmdB family regulatory protein
MPKYIYKCNVCEEHFEVHHGMMENHTECVLCPSGDLNRVPQMPYIKRSLEPRAGKVGEKTNAAIEANREVLNDMKKNASKEYYRDDN